MKPRTGEDALGGYIHTATFNPANSSDIAEAYNLVREDDEFRDCDAGYQGIEGDPRSGTTSTCRRSTSGWR